MFRVSDSGFGGWVLKGRCSSSCLQILHQGGSNGGGQRRDRQREERGPTTLVRSAFQI